MKSFRNRRGFTLMELLVGLMLFAIGLSLLVPNGRGTKDAASTKVAAEELVARFRQARQTAITKAVPVAVAFPTTSSLSHTDQAYFLEGEFNPRVTEQWKIHQSFVETVYYTGQWIGPSWSPAPVLKTAGLQYFERKGSLDINSWFGPAGPPSANTLIFTPSGNVVSTLEAADGKFRVVVAMGVSGVGGTLTTASSPYTVWLSPSGEAGFEKGVFQGPSVIEGSNKDSTPIAPFSRPPAVPNRPPVVQRIDGGQPGAKAYPNAVNPRTGKGNVMDLDTVLTLEIRVKDEDGDPPYFRWETAEVGRAVTGGTSFSNETDFARWGGRFSNATEVRMVWDPETQEWVGRDTWTPAPEDLGGNRYRLECTITDRKGGVARSGFPIDGNYLVTTKEPWILYKTWNAQNRAELWKMTLDGEEHSRVAAFTYQDVEFGQWTPSAAEIIVGAPDGIYRTSADGGGLRKLGPKGFNGPVDGSCLSPQGDAVYYVGGEGGKKQIRKFSFSSAGAPQNTHVMSFGNVNDINDLSAARFGTGSSAKTILLSSYFYDNKSGGLFGTGLFRKRRRGSGGMAVDTDTGAQIPSSSRSPGTWDGVGQYRENSYGNHMLNTNDSVGHGVHVLYVRRDGSIYGNRVNYTGGPASDANLTLGAPIFGPLNTGRPGTRHPRYASTERDSLVFISGRGTAGTLYRMPDITKPQLNVALRLAPQNRGADQPSVSRPR